MLGSLSDDFYLPDNCLIGSPVLQEFFKAQTTDKIHTIITGVKNVLEKLNVTW